MARIAKTYSNDKPSRRASRPAGGNSFDWPLAYNAEEFLRKRLNDFFQRNSFAHDLARRMQDQTGTDFFEWTDHLVLDSAEEPRLRGAGFVRDRSAETLNGEIVYEHRQATLPRVLLRRGQSQAPFTVALRPEFLEDFIARHNVSATTEGESLSRFRRVVVSEKNGTRLEAVERRAYRGFVAARLKPGERASILDARDLWQSRPRSFANPAEGFGAVNRTLDRVIALVGRDVACQFFFEAERAYWESRNHAAQVQKRRQDQLGLGWGNHDHHTFRCSRAHFVDLIEFLLRLGFHKRERFYAGAEAGWGAQICEQPVAGIVVFADVDLMPEETELDFSTHPLPPASRLGTVGLWTALHGESFLEAGMHHLEARFDFNLVRSQLEKCGVAMMKPFSEFDFLQQAFTEGERWPVRPERAKRLLAARLITAEQCQQFISKGALGSHLENLQRHGGFKGFNQRSVSAVIAATDPRKHQLERARAPAAA